MILFFFLIILTHLIFFFFFFNDTATTEIYTLSLHDALPIYGGTSVTRKILVPASAGARPTASHATCSSRQESLRKTSRDRKSTRLNSSHVRISYAVFCLKKKKKNKYIERRRQLTNIYK